MQEYVRAKGLRIVVIFEGRDAAGKGGVIKRIAERTNPRVCRVVALPRRRREKSNGSHSAMADFPRREIVCHARGTTARVERVRVLHRAPYWSSSICRVRVCAAALGDRGSVLFRSPTRQSAASRRACRSMRRCKLSHRLGREPAGSLLARRTNVTLQEIKVAPWDWCSRRQAPARRTESGPHLRRDRTRTSPAPLECRQRAEEAYYAAVGGQTSCPDLPTLRMSGSRSVIVSAAGPRVKLCLCASWCRFAARVRRAASQRAGFDESNRACGSAHGKAVGAALLGKRAPVIGSAAPRGHETASSSVVTGPMNGTSGPRCRASWRARHVASASST